jgi:predicted nucleotidyltransferase
MIETIKSELNIIEQSENIRILHCIESGSRAWGFASPDSDYDVRFIYVRKPEFYLRLDKTRDVIGWRTDDILDINGWDLQKALRLLHTSNPTLFEWNQSPIVYKTTPEWAEVRKIIDSYFVSKSGVHHYLSTATGNYREYLKGEEVKLKKYFYVLRPLLACKWIMDKGTPPPMLFSKLCDAELDAEINPYVHELLVMKRNTPEVGVGARIEPLNDYLDHEIVRIKELADAMPKEQKQGWNELNALFLAIAYGKQNG